MTGDELVQAGADALAEDRYPGTPANQWHVNIAQVILDAVEPLILADARAQNEGARVTFTVTADGLVADIDDPLEVGWTRLALDLIPQLVANDRDARRLANLRDKVEALPIWQDSQGWKVVSYADVHALIDGGSDDR